MWKVISAVCLSFVFVSSGYAGDTHVVYSVDDLVLRQYPTFPPKLFFDAIGTVPSTGWTNARLVPYVYVKPPADGIWEFSFVADSPDEVAATVLQPVPARFVFDSIPEGFKGVRVYASTNRMESQLKDVKVLKTAVGDAVTSTTFEGVVSGLDVQRQSGSFKAYAFLTNSANQEIQVITRDQRFQTVLEQASGNYSSIAGKRPVVEVTYSTSNGEKVISRIRFLDR